MNQIAKAKLPMLLKELRLPTFYQLWEELAEKGKKLGWDRSQYLEVLCEHELSDRKDRRIKRHMQEANLPYGKGLSTFEFKLQSQIEKAEIEALASGEVWLNQGENLLIFGPSGTGKTHLAAGIGAALVERGYRIYFTRTTELLQKLQAAKRNLSLPSKLQKLDKYDCLILDDFGYVKKNNDETEVLFELICERYERKSIVITCNQAFSQWDEIFKDRAMALAAIDRIVHHSRIIEVSGESYRKKEVLLKTKEIVLQKQESGAVDHGEAKGVKKQAVPTKE
jgi:DNA replication protein DnaC